MFSGNITNFLMSMEDKKTKKWVIDHADPAVRSILCAQVSHFAAFLFLESVFAVSVALALCIDVLMSLDL